MFKHLVFILLLLSAGAHAQSASPAILGVSIFNSSTSIPFTRFVTTPIHPGIQLAAGKRLRDWQKGQWAQHIVGGYYFHNHFAQGAFLGTEMSMARWIADRFSLGGRIGVGYLHTFATQQEYTLQDGEFRPRADRGNARVRPTIAIEAGAFIGKASAAAPMVFLRYQPWLEFPFSPGFIPVMTHTELHLGMQIQIGK